MPHATFITTRLLLLIGIRMYKCTFLQCIKIVYYHVDFTTHLQVDVCYS